LFAAAYVASIPTSQGRFEKALLRRHTTPQLEGTEVEIARISRTFAVSNSPIANAMPDPAPTTNPTSSDDGDTAADNVHDLGRQMETGLQRVLRMQHETHALAREQIELLTRDLGAMAQRAGEIAEGGDAFPVGIRELCSRLADELVLQAQTMKAILDRAPED
jgi:hypothetical protein